MSKVHPRPWRRGSVFGVGFRLPLCRERRARFKYLVNAHRRSRRLTPLAEMIGNALVRRLGTDGQLDPSHDTIAGDVGCCSRTVRRALAALRAVGLVMWQCRIVRTGPCVDQISNAYVLLTPHGNPTGGQNGRQTSSLDKSRELLPSADDIAAAKLAREGLASIAAARTHALGLACRGGVRAKSL
jgi:hypothetical protein